MTYKEAKRINLDNIKSGMKVADVYANTGSFSKQYQEAKRTRKRLVKV